MSDPARRLASIYFGLPDGSLGEIGYEITARFDDATYRVDKDGWTLIERHAPRQRHPYNWIWEPEPPSS